MASQYQFRPGQWVKFKPLKLPAGVDPDSVQRTKDGFVVGIFHVASRASHGTVVHKDAKTGKEEKVELRFPPRVFLVKTNGENVRYINAEGEIEQALWFPPSACPELQPVLNKDEIPAARLQHNPEFVPVA